MIELPCCPWCGKRTLTVGAEIKHMEKDHPDIVEARLQSAGLLTELEQFRKER